MQFSSSKRTVVVGMSGGVDSSVTAFLLKEMGYNVIGMFMKNWEEKDPNGVCKSSKEYEDVIRVCEALQIPYYSVNFVKEYQENVFSHFLEELKLGYTPNPDILCNREIKFKVFLEKALSFGADYLATGHYCRTQANGQESQLLKGLDPGKDQSYFVYTLKSEQLKKVLFPIGHLQKSEVRKIAEKAGLPTFAKKDSTGICFIGKRDFKEFLSSYLPPQIGYFKRLNGEIVAEHEGAFYYTLGQRKGLAIGGAGEAWFVVAKDIKNNIVFVEQGADHSALYCDELTATEITWVLPCAPLLPLSCTAKVRYRQSDQECVIEEIKDGVAKVKFKEPQRSVTPRQSIVFYDKDICLGGGMIQTAGPSYFEMGKCLNKTIFPSQELNLV